MVLSFFDRCGGLNKVEIKKLLRSKSTSPDTEQGLQLVCDILDLEKELDTTRKSMEEIRNQLSLHPSPALDRTYDEQEQRYNVLTVKEDMYHDQLVKSRRYQRGRFVFVIPAEFLFDDEVAEYVSEGVLLFLHKPMISQKNCVRLAAMKQEIQCSQVKLSKLNTRQSQSAAEADVQHSDIKQQRIKLAWLHLERKLLLQMLCCTTLQDQRRQIRLFEDRLACYRSLENEFSNHNDEQIQEIQSFVRKTTFVFQEYIRVLNSVEKSESDGHWRLNAFGQRQHSRSFQSRNLPSSEDDGGSTKSWRQCLDEYDYNKDVDYRSHQDGNKDFDYRSNRSGSKDIDCRNKKDGSPSWSNTTPVFRDHDNRRTSYDNGEEWRHSGSYYNDEQKTDSNRRRRQESLEFEDEMDRRYHEKYSYHGYTSEDARYDEDDRNWRASRYDYDRREAFYNNDCWDSYNTYAEYCKTYDRPNDAASSYGSGYFVRQYPGHFSGGWSRHQYS